MTAGVVTQRRDATDSSVGAVDVSVWAFVLGIACSTVFGLAACLLLGVALVVRLVPNPFSGREPAKSKQTVDVAEFSGRRSAKKRRRAQRGDEGINGAAREGSRGTHKMRLLRSVSRAETASTSSSPRRPSSPSSQHAAHARTHSHNGASHSGGALVVEQTPQRAAAGAVGTTDALPGVAGDSESEGEFDGVEQPLLFPSRGGGSSQRRDSFIRNMGDLRMRLDEVDGTLT